MGALTFNLATQNENFQTRILHFKKNFLNKKTDRTKPNPNCNIKQTWTKLNFDSNRTEQNPNLNFCGFDSHLYAKVTLFWFAYAMRILSINFFSFTAQICAVKLKKFILNICILGGFHAPKSVCFQCCAPATGPNQEVHLCSRLLASIFGLGSSSSVVTPISGYAYVRVSNNKQ